MKPLKVEFAPPRRLPGWAWIGLSAVFLTIAVQQGWEAWNLHQQVLVLRSEAAALSAQVEAARKAQREAEERARTPPPYAKDAAVIARMAAFPLDRVLRVLESVRIEGIRLTSVDISTEEGSVRAELRYASLDVLLRYVDELNAGEPAPRWRLQQAQASKQDPGADNAGVATISSRWTGADG